MAITEQDALQALMRSRSRLSAAAWLVVRDTHAAEDIFQNVAVKAMTRNFVFESESALMSWAYITARHEGIDWLRKRSRESSCMDPEILELLETEWQTQGSHPTGAKIEALQSCLDSAPAESKRLLKLRYFDGFSCEEVAQKMGIGLNAIYKRVSRLHETLRVCVEGKLSARDAAAGGGN